MYVVIIHLSVFLPTEYSMFGYFLLDNLMHYNKQYVIYKKHLVNTYTIFAGSCYIPTTDDESVIALATNSTDEILLTGDTKGFIQVWDIKDYCICNTTTVRQK